MCGADTIIYDVCVSAYDLPAHTAARKRHMRVRILLVCVSAYYYVCVSAYYYVCVSAYDLPARAAARKRRGDELPV